jgi:hypothetical protein
MAYTGNGAFGGLDARRAAADGAIRDMENMSLRYSPAIATRLGRRRIATNYKDFQGAYFGDRDYIVRSGKLYDNGTAVCDVSSGVKSMCMLEKNLWVFPDRIRYNTDTKEVYNFGAATQENITNYKYAEINFVVKQTGDVFIETEYFNDLLVFRYSDFPNIGFSAGELVKIRMRKTTDDADAYKEFVLRVEKRDTKYITSPGFTGEQRVETLQFPLGSFESVYGTNRTQIPIKIEIAYAIPPDMDGVFASDNRLWGYKGREIYASSLGDGSEWMDYDTLTTSSWAATTKTGDTITAGCDFGGMPVFFAENAVYKIYGENPKEFQYVRQDIIGITAGDHKSVAVGAGYIFYLTRRGVYAWTGGVPQLISAPLGEERITDAVGGSDGAVYYLSCKQGGRQNLYVFDPMTFTWMREDDTAAVDIRLRRRDLCLIASNGYAYLIGDVYSIEGTAIPTDGYYIETADYTDGAVQLKSAKNILIDYELSGGEADVCVSYDGEPWDHVYTLYDTDGKRNTSVIPLREKRYRTMRIRVEGSGEIIIYYMVRDVMPRTERPGGEKNVYQ